nr:sporulation integral membrane protein YtvI [Lachnoclostridium phocaeense]
MEKKRAFLINIGYYGFFVILLLLAARYLLPVLMPFLVAFVLAFLIQRPAVWIARRLRAPKGRLSVLLLVLVYVAVFGVAFSGGGRVFAVIREFVIDVPDIYRRDILPLLNYVLEGVAENLSEADPFVSAQIENSLQQAVQSIGQMVSGLSVTLLQMVSEFITGVPSVLIRVVLTVITSFYICSDYDRILAALWRLLPDRWQNLCRDIKQYGLNMIRVYIRSYSLLFLLTFTELTIGFLIFQIPHSLLVAVLIAIFDILPVLGTGGVLIPWAVILAVIGNYPLAAGILILYVIITVVRNSVEPRIVGKQIGLHPLLTLIAMFTGVSLAGLPGLILLPMAVMIFVNMEKNGAIHIFGGVKEENRQERD